MMILMPFAWWYCLLPVPLSPRSHVSVSMETHRCNRHVWNLMFFTFSSPADQTHWTLFLFHVKRKMDSIISGCSYKLLYVWKLGLLPSEVENNATGVYLVSSIFQLSFPSLDVAICLHCFTTTLPCLWNSPGGVAVGSARVPISCSDLLCAQRPDGALAATWAISTSRTPYGPWFSSCWQGQVGLWSLHEVHLQETLC